MDNFEPGIYYLTIEFMLSNRSIGGTEMIPDLILSRLIPEKYPPGVEVVANEGGLIQSRLTAWALFAQRELLNFANKIGSSDDRINLCKLIGVGVGRPSTQWKKSEHFPVVEGFQFGVYMYIDAGVFNYFKQRDMKLWEWVESTKPSDYIVPMNWLEAQYEEHFNPAGGRAAAIVSYQGNPALLTPVHVVGRPCKVGTTLQFVCSTHGANCNSTASTVASVAGPFVDAALYDASSPCFAPLHGIATQPAPTQPYWGQHVTVHTPNGNLLATITQGAGSPQLMVNSVQPRNFLIDLSGQCGDSGSVISDGHNSANIVNGILMGKSVGMYLGCVPTSQGKQGYFIELDYAISILGSTFVSGLAG